MVLEEKSHLNQQKNHFVTNTEYHYEQAYRIICHILLINRKGPRNTKYLISDESLRQNISIRTLVES